MSAPKSQDRLYERREYKHPPVREAVCEFRLQPVERGWNAATPGQYYERVRGLYTADPVQRAVSSAELPPLPGAPPLVVQAAVPGVQFADDSRSNLISLAPDTLAVHVLPPYPGWEGFLERIENAVSAYEEVMPERLVNRIGLRYINHVKIPTSHVALPDYFESPPTTPDSFPEHILSVFARWESAYDLETHNRRLIFTFASVPTEGDASTFSLDLDIIQFFTESVPASEALSSLTELKRLETEAFEALLTDRTRELFDAE